MEKKINDNKKIPKKIPRKIKRKPKAVRKRKAELARVTRMPRQIAQGSHDGRQSAYEYLTSVLHSSGSIQRLPSWSNFQSCIRPFSYRVTFIPNAAGNFGLFIPFANLAALVGGALLEPAFIANYAAFDPALSSNAGATTDYHGFNFFTLANGAMVDSTSEFAMTMGANCNISLSGISALNKAGSLYIAEVISGHSAFQTNPATLITTTRVIDACFNNNSLAFIGRNRCYKKIQIANYSESKPIRYNFIPNARLPTISSFGWVPFLPTVDYLYNSPPTNCLIVLGKGLPGTTVVEVEIKGSFGVLPNSYGMTTYSDLLDTPQYTPMANIIEKLREKPDLLLQVTDEEHTKLESFNINSVL
jgi:hypothetical protein